MNPQKPDGSGQPPDGPAPESDLGVPPPLFPKRRDLPPLPDWKAEFPAALEKGKLLSFRDDLEPLPEFRAQTDLPPLPGEKARELPPLPDLEEEIRRLESADQSPLPERKLPPLPNLEDELRLLEEPAARELPPLPDLDEELKRLEEPPKRELPPLPDLEEELLSLKGPPEKELPALPNLEEELARLEPPPSKEPLIRSAPAPNLELVFPEPPPPTPEPEPLPVVKPLEEVKPPPPPQPESRRYGETVEMKRPEPSAPTIREKEPPTLEKPPTVQKPERLKPNFAVPTARASAETIEFTPPPKKKPSKKPAKVVDTVEAEKSTTESRERRPLRRQVASPPPREESPQELKSLIREHYEALRWGSGPKASREQLAVLTRQMAAMINAGIPVHSVLDFCVQDDSELSRVMEGLANKVTTGISLTQALRDYPGVFDPVFVGLVHTAELSGQLSTVFVKLAEMLERQVAMKKKVIAALTYPAILLLVAALGVVGFVYFVLPSLTPLFDSMEMDLPVMTKMLLASRKGIPIALATALIWTVGLWFGRPLWQRELDRRPALRRFLHGIPLRLPVVGKTVEKLVTARVLYSMAGMLDVGIGMAQALARSEAAAGNEYVAHRLRMARGDLSDGMTVYECLSNHNVFPEAALQLIMVGEEAADLAKMFTYVADWFEDEVEHSLTMLTSMLEPLIMVGMGIVVGFISISAAMPTIQLLANLS